ncbi:hypothetical protein [Devosia sp.]|uniref:AbrB/MazE/SpoVT family DNA-binding domain-containing protein n=1 Tax=Devosia sp. TaxID=1871048 RepID=UPI002EFAB502
MARNTVSGRGKTVATGPTPARRDNGEPSEGPFKGFAEEPNASGPRVGASAVAGSSTGYLATTRLKKAGGSLVMTVPAAARDLLRLTEGQEMMVSVEGAKVIVEPMPAPTPAVHVRRPKYTLEELLADADPQAPLSEEERAWHDTPPAGRETW